MESTDPASVAPEGVSPSVRRALTLPRPRWRGTMHRTAIPLTITAGVVLVLHGSGPSDRVGAGVLAQTVRPSLAAATALRASSAPEVWNSPTT